MRPGLLTILVIFAACYIHSIDAQSAQSLDHFVAPNFDECRCDVYIPAEGGGIDGKTVFFSPCDKSFAIMKVDNRLNFLKRVKGTSDKSKIEETWRNYFYEVTLTLNKTGTGAEAQWYEGKLSIKKGREQNVIKVVGSCGL